MAQRGFIGKDKKEDFSHLKESEYIKKWLKNIKSKNARLSVMDRYCNFTDKTPDELILEHNKDRIKEPIEQKEFARNQILAFYKYLIGKKNEFNNKKIDKTISKNSARQYAFSKIASFYKRNLVPIVFQKGDVPKEDIKGTMDKVFRNGDNIINPAETKKWFKNIIDSFRSIRNRAIVYCKISSGLDDIDLFKLKIGDFKDGYYKDYNICYVEGSRIKNEEYYQTFFNNEACDMLSNYLKDRERKGEKLTKKSWLFVGDKKDRKIDATDDIKRTYNQMKPSLFYSDLQAVCQKLNLKNITPKSFRRWFSTQLTRNKVDFEIKERMMGHSITVSKSYELIFSDVHTFVKKYVDEIEIITLLGNGGRKLTKIDKEVEKLKIDNEALRNEMVNMKEMMGEFVSALYFSSIEDGIKDPTDERKEFDSDKLKEVFEKYFKKSK